MNAATDKAFELQIGSWRVAPSLNRIDGPGGTQSLQPLSMQVLAHLASRPGEVITYEELLQAHWPRRFTGEEAIHRRIANLRQHLGDTARAPRYIENIPKCGYRLIAPVRQAEEEPPPVAGRRGMGIALAACVLAAVALSLAVKQDAGAPVVEPDALGAIRAAIEDEQYVRALEALESLPPALRESAEARELRAELVLPVDLETSPPGADVRVRRYGDEHGEWKPLGVTPLSTTLPKGTWLLRLVADGRATTELALPNPSLAFNNTDAEPFKVILPAAGDVLPGMVHVPAFEAYIPLLGFRRFEDIGEFQIGRTEVSNAEFAEFVASDGYRRPDLWVDLLESSDAMPFDEVARNFVDATGKPGPAGWADGRYEPGSETLPVTGVSWYEAMAYARYRGLTLPSAPHWARAALGINERKWPLAGSLLAVAHLEGAGPVPATTAAAVSTFGAVNLVGNVREWTRSYSGDNKLSLGSSFAGPRWGYAMPRLVHPLSRVPDQGFRLAAYDADFPIEPISLDGKPPQLPVVSEADYRAIADGLRYTAGAEPVAAVVVSERDEGEWIRRRVLLPTDREDDPLPVMIFMPGDPADALQPVIFFPPGDSYIANSNSEDIDIRSYDIDFLPRNGRALVWPVLWGTHERFRGGDFDPETKPFGRAIKARRQEIGRVIDFLVDSPEFDGDRIAVLAASYGVSFVAPFILATETRIKAAVLLAGTLAPWDPARAPQAINPNTFWPKVRLPTLVANGVYDLMRTSQSDISPLYEALGTPPGDKRYIPYESAHWPLPKHRVRKDTLAWLDAHAGPAGTISTTMSASAEPAGTRNE